MPIIYATKVQASESYVYTAKRFQGSIRLLTLLDDGRIRFYNKGTIAVNAQRKMTSICEEIQEALMEYSRVHELPEPEEDTITMCVPFPNTLKSEVEGSEGFRLAPHGDHKVNFHLKYENGGVTVIERRELNALKKVEEE